MNEQSIQWIDSARGIEVLLIGIGRIFEFPYFI